MRGPGEKYHTNDKRNHRRAIHTVYIQPRDKPTDTPPKNREVSCRGTDTNLTRDRNAKRQSE